MPGNEEHVFRCFRCKRVFPSLDIHPLTTCPTCGGIARRVWGMRIDWHGNRERREG